MKSLHLSINCSKIKQFFFYITPLRLAVARVKSSKCFISKQFTEPLHGLFRVLPHFARISHVTIYSLSLLPEYNHPKEWVDITTFPCLFFSRQLTYKYLGMNYFKAVLGDNGLYCASNRLGLRSQQPRL
jgi:hypothetical protein